MSENWLPRPDVAWLTPGPVELLDSAIDAAFIEVRDDASVAGWADAQGITLDHVYLEFGEAQRSNKGSAQEEFETLVLQAAGYFDPSRSE